MNKRFIGFITMLAAAATTASVYSADTEGEITSMPTGAAQPVIREIVSSDGEPEIMSETELGLMEDAPKFYSYGSDYGYRDMDKRSNSGDRKKCYEELLERCEWFASYTEDIQATDIKVMDAETGNTVFERVYFLPELPNASHDYDLTETELAEVYYTFRNDHPEYYWLSTEVLFSTQRVTNSVTGAIISEKTIPKPCVFGDYAMGSERNRLDDAIESSTENFISRAKELNSPYDMVKQVHDDIAASVNYGYDENGVALDTAYAHSIVGVMDGDSSTDVVCEGYAKAFQLVLNALEIDNIYVVGLGNGGNHAWNMARLDDGEYYWFDVTWDDQSWGHNYFAKGTMNFDLHAAFAPINTGTYFLYELPEVPNEDFDLSSIVRATSAPTAKPTETPTATPTAKPTETPTATPTASPKPIKVELTRGRYDDDNTHIDDGFYITPDNYITNSTLYIAVYAENGVLINVVREEDYGNKDGIYLPVSGRGVLKVFIFENETMIPLSDAAKAEFE